MPVIVHGESFGALPAAATEALLPDEPGGLVLLVPYLKSLPPSEWVENTPFRPGNAEYQARWEAATLGLADERTRALFNKEVAGVYAMRQPSRPAFLLFGASDRASKAADLPHSLTIKADTVVVKGDHGFASVWPEAWASLDAWLEKHSLMRSQALSD